MVEPKLVSFAALVALWTLEILLIEVTRILLTWKYTQDKNYAMFAATFRKQSYFVRFPRDLGPGFWYEHIEIFYERKSGEARFRKPSQPDRPNLHAEALKSVFHLSSQIGGCFIEALSQTGVTNQSNSISYWVRFR